MTKKILIVDDEVQLLKVLKRVFMKMDYCIYLAENGYQALELLESESIDMIITDLRMPGMDGYELLTEVKRRYPDVIRIVLSGYADEKMIYQLFKNNLTKMWIYKPWDNASLVLNVNQVFELNNILTSNHILQIIKNLEQLPVMNNIYSELCDLMEANVGIDEIERLLMKDQSIVASILHIANSAFFNVSTGSLKKAIAYIGLNQTKNIVLVASITNIKSQNGKLKTIYDMFTTHSIITNKICNLIYKDMLLKEIPPDNSCIGLLHGIGRMVLMDNFASQYEKIIHLWRLGGGLLYQIEKDSLGVSHQELSGYLLNWWGLPYSLVEPILYHHEPWEDGVINKELTYVLYIADHYATKYIKEPWPEPLDEKAFKYLGIDMNTLEISLKSKLNIA
jgi:HD-like signal output (HDOD) protein